MNFKVKQHSRVHTNDLFAVACLLFDALFCCFFFLVFHKDYFGALTRSSLNWNVISEVKKK